MEVAKTFVAILLSLMVAASGCSENAERETIEAEGQVTVDGAELSGAVITFEPIGDTTGPNASVPIFGGRFHVPRESGLHGGTYRVRISMIPAEILQSLPAEQQHGLPASEAIISPQYDADSTLHCDLKLDEANKLTFEIDFL